MKRGKHAVQKTRRDMFAFVNSAARKRRKEVFERQMFLEERETFSIQPGATGNMTLGEPTEDYRLDEKENVILEYLDPNCKNRPPASPNMTRNTRHLL